MSGVRESVNAGSLAAELSTAGMIPLKIEITAEAGERAKQKFQLLAPKVISNELIVFSHQMASLSRAGVSIVRAVRTLSESSRNEYFADVLADVAINLESGIDIASSLGRHPRVFSELYVSLVHVGENTGRLEDAFTAQCL